MTVRHPLIPHPSIHLEGAAVTSEPTTSTPAVVVDRRHRPWTGRLRDRRVLQVAFDEDDRRCATLEDLDRIVRRALP